MFDSRFEDAAREWKEDFARWEAGARPSCAEDETGEYWEWQGPPDRDFYRPWTDEEATWFQVWETVSEGTPVSPPFATQEELIEYLVANGDFWDQSRRARGVFMECGPWPREAAEAFVRRGSAPSLVVDEKGVRTGVQSLGDPPCSP